MNTHKSLIYIRVLLYSFFGGKRRLAPIPAPRVEATTPKLNVVLMSNPKNSAKSLTLIHASTSAIALSKYTSLPMATATKVYRLRSDSSAHMLEVQTIKGSVVTPKTCTDVVSKQFVSLHNIHSTVIGILGEYYRL